MPYINEEMRSRCQFKAGPLEERIDFLITHIRDEYDKGELEGVCNHTISRIVAGVMRPKNGWRYKWLNRAYGTFMSAGAEFYRRLVAPYEDECIKKNGDIPEYEG